VSVTVAIDLARRVFSLTSDTGSVCRDNGQRDRLRSFLRWSRRQRPDSNGHKWPGNVIHSDRSNGKKHPA